MTKIRTQSFGWVVAAIDDMIEETLYFCEVFAHTLHAHHNTKAAQVFEKAGRVFAQEAEVLIHHKQALVLPKIAPWEKPHGEYEHPVTWLLHAEYQMTEVDAWKMVGKLVQIHNCFYEHLRQTHTMEETLQLVTTLKQFCKHCAQDAKNMQDTEVVLEDLDPPIGQS